MKLRNLQECFNETSAQCAKVSPVGVELSPEFKAAFASFVEDVHPDGYENVVFDRGTVFLKSRNGKKSFIPSAGFIWAKYLVAYYNMLIAYKDRLSAILGRALNTEEENIKSMKNSGKIVPVYQAAFDSFALDPEERPFLEKFLTKYDWWGGGKDISRGDFFVSPLMKCAGLQAESQSAIAELAKTLSEHEDLLKLLNYSTVDIENVALAPQDNASAASEKTKDDDIHGRNILLYGLPGAGKSWTVEHEYCGDKRYMERIVFHPDYTYSDFVGQILPRLVSESEDNNSEKPKADNKKKVAYVFSPGPFTRLLKKAIDDDHHHYFLVIEELNRGNAPAIFGDTFQLLDRDDDKRGRSLYDIQNADIADAVFGDSTAPVFIPHNMSIIGTMNSSDQNVFTLDTAFQRRWHMHLIENDLSKVSHNFITARILDSTITWGRFLKVIDEAIVRKNVNLSSSEDKRLAAYFIKPSDLSFDSREFDGADESVKAEAKKHNGIFADKIFKYLWDDAFKFSRQDVFGNTEGVCLEDIVRVFKTSHGDDRFKVFSDDIYKALVADDNE